MLTTRTKVKIARLASRLIRSARALFGGNEIVNARRLGLVWRLDLTEGIDLAIYLSCYERDTLRRYRSLVGAGARVMDIGANMGVHTLVLARLVGPLGHVHAVEPTRFALDKLKRNLALNPEPASIVTVSQSMLLASMDAHLPENVVSSWPLTDRATLTTALAGAHRSTAGASLETLDAVVERWDPRSLELIKLDVDGHELDVLRGGMKTLSTFTPNIVMELCPHLSGEDGNSFAELIEFVRNLGYEMFDMTTDAPLPLVPSSLEKSIAWGAGKNVLLRRK